MGSICNSHMVFLIIAFHGSFLMIMAKSLNIGVCYGMLGDNLPPPAEVISLYKQYGITRMRLFDPNPSVLQALRGSKIKVTLGIRNEDIPSLASSLDATNSWFSRNMEPYIHDINFVFVVVGNEVVPGGYANSVAPAMQNLLNVLRHHNLRRIKVTTSLAGNVLQNTYPPSASEFQPEAYGPMVNILKVLSSQGAGSALMINVYPYFAYASDPIHVRKDYALFTAPATVVRDGSLEYQNLFSAMVDALYWAMEKAGFHNVGVAVSESGWPSAGNGDFTTPQLASIYNKNFVRQIVRNVGTPKKPGIHIEGFIFAMFNENLKPAGVEQHWGLFYPNKQPAYSVFSNY